MNIGFCDKCARPGELGAKHYPASPRHDNVCGGTFVADDARPGKTAMYFNGQPPKATKGNDALCSVCFQPGEVNTPHRTPMPKPVPIESGEIRPKQTKKMYDYYVPCAGRFKDVKRMENVRKYRKQLIADGVRFQEHMFINCCLCVGGFSMCAPGRGIMCRPGQMVVVFTW